MSISVILAHPRAGSFNHAIAAACVSALRRNGRAVHFHDLCAEGFDPLLPASEFARDTQLPPAVRAHCEEIAAASGIVIVHPNWWGQPPAILKGWVDRVIRPGVAYEFSEGDAGEGVPCGLLKARSAVVFNTSNTDPEREREAFGDPLELIWRHCIFGLCGVNDVTRRTFGIVVTSTEAQRRAWLQEAADTVARIFPRPACGLASPGEGACTEMSKIVSEEDLALLVQAGLSQEDIRHSILVARKAVEIAARTGMRLDVQLVARGALFHDLGKALTHSYQHGELGAEIGKSLGLPKAITDIARKHFHGGLTPKEARALDLPPVDYTPRLLEERIILYADRLVDILTEGHFAFKDDQEAEARFEEIVTTHRAYGKDKLTSGRYVEYHRELAALIERAKTRPPLAGEGGVR